MLFYNLVILTVLNKKQDKHLKPGMFRAFLLCICIALLTANTPAAVFQIEAPASDTLQIKSALEYHLDKINKILDIDYTDTVRVIIAANIESFKQSLGGEFPDWGAAVAIKQKKLIIIKSPAHFNIGKSLEELLGHELGHLMLDKASGGRWLPRWFEEGFCQLISGEWRFSNDILVTRAVWGSGLIPLTALEGVNKFGGAKASLAYAQSYLAVSSLVQEFGIEIISDFLTDYRETGNIYRAFFKATGYRYAEWDELWQKRTTDRYRMVLFLFDSGLFFAMLAVFFILLYIIKRYLMWKKKKRWEAEEKLQGYD